MIGRSSLAAMVESRARQRCEYCKMHQSLQGATFHVEHIIPESRGGSGDLNNVAWACPSCNLRKSERVEIFDPHDATLVSIYHPRLNPWDDHFQWEGFHIVGKTAIGRATLFALDLNHARRVRIREAENLFGLFAGQ